VKRRRIARPKDEAPEEIRERAGLLVPEALEELARLVREAESETAKISAIKEILDRAHGRPAAPSGGTAGAPRHVLVDDGYRD
jgi:hypothetical protein